MRERLALVAYLIAVVIVTLISHPAPLAAGLAAVALAAGADRWRFARRAAGSILLFGAAVSLPWAALSLYEGRPFVDYLLLVNLRIALLAYLTVLMVARVDLLRAFDFSPLLLFLLLLAYSQALTLRRVAAEFRLALLSRRLQPLTWREGRRHAAVTAGQLVEKALDASGEVAQAMRSRGYFHD